MQDKIKVTRKVNDEDSTPYQIGFLMQSDQFRIPVLILRLDRYQYLSSVRISFGMLLSLYYFISWKLQLYIKALGSLCLNR